MQMPRYLRKRGKLFVVTYEDEILRPEPKEQSNLCFGGAARLIYNDSVNPFYLPRAMIHILAEEYWTTKWCIE